MGGSFTNDPSYAAYFYSNSRFDPRLPPPSFYSPGQSWQMWPTSASRNNSAVIGGNLRQPVQRQPVRDGSEAAGRTSYSQRKKLVDMIQEDFPRTPSPVHTLSPQQQQQQQPQQALQSPQQASQTGIHLLGEPSMEPPGEKTRKPFSISGSVDAVMAAAIEAESDIEISFGMQKLNLFPANEEDEEEIEASKWGKSLRLGQQNSNSEIEPFAYAENFVPYIPVHAATLTSTSSRTFPSAPVYNAYPASYPDENLKHVIMEDFRMNRSKRYELFDLKGMMIDFSTDQHGSRFIQQKLETASEAEKEAVFTEIYPLALQLMTDVFGNYVIQKFFEHGSREQRVALAHVMHGHVLNLSLQMYGCRVVQKALEHVPGDEQIRLVQELEGHVLRCVKDQNGNHVIQKCIECVPLKTSAPFLTASFLSQASTLAMHPYGCRVIQRIFEHGPPDHSQALLDELLKNTGTLIQDQYGNYVIQHVLEHGHPSERSRIIKFLQGRLLEFSRHKFASNVVEKCVSFGMESERRELIEEILTPIPSEDGNSSSTSMEGGEVIPLHLMMKDQFANYVVQKMLEIVDGEQRDMLLNCIKPQLFQLKKYTYGKHILAKVERMLGLTPSESVPIVTERSGSGYHGYNSHNSHSGHSGYGHQSQSQGHGYHSAPSSPVSRGHDFPQSPSHHQPPHHQPSHFPHRPQEYRRPAPSSHSRISKNDLNEFPPLNSRKK